MDCEEQSSYELGDQYTTWDKYVLIKLYMYTVIVSSCGICI